VDFVGDFPNHGVSLQLSGSFRLLQRRNGKTSERRMRPGDITVTPIGEPKRVQHAAGGDVLVLHLAPKLFTKIVDGMDDKRHRKVELLDNFGTRDFRLEYLARQLYFESLADDFATGIAAEAMSMSLAVHLLRHYSSAKQLPLLSPVGLSRSKLNRATDYINSYLQDDLTVADIADVLAMSTSNFAHAFRQTVGISPHRYVVERRIDRAKMLLTSTELSVAQVAHRVGYSRQSHFTMVFRRVTGVTPGVFRGLVKK
jgi:AraC family transcriptional regulator